MVYNGTFPRILGKYAREEKVITMEDAVNKMTGYTAQRFNFQNRDLMNLPGRLAVRC